MSEEDDRDGALPSAIQAEIGQTRPFRSRAQEATIALLRTASVVSRVLSRVIEPEGISLAQYNVLRILRGAGPEGLPTLAIRERMIEEGASITRLLDKLEEAGLARRERCREDRRQVLCHLTADGRALLDRMDPRMDAADDEVMGMLTEPDLASLVSLLDAIRSRHRRADRSPGD
jgi:DNA-binding MarR family transcriptional regulator